MHKIGLPESWAVGEVFGFDEDLLAFLPQPVVGVIVNVERLKKEEDKGLGSEENNGKVNYYMKQSGTLDNACGIIACLHAALNNLDQINLKDDSILHKFYNQMKEKTPAERCTGLENDNDFKQQHAGYAA